MNTEDNSTQDKDVVVNAVNAGNLVKFSNALKAADLVGTFKGMGPFTFFAPTDAAFDKLGRSAYEALLKDKAKLAATLNFHVIRASILTKDIKESESQSIQGGALTFADTGDGFTVNGARVSKQEIEASNGVIHSIDTVMLPKQ